LAGPGHTTVRIKQIGKKKQTVGPVFTIVLQLRRRSALQPAGLAGFIGKADEVVPFFLFFKFRGQCYF
jgi:hypothetical protein